jgi:hypothetical protein
MIIETSIEKEVFEYQSKAPPPDLGELPTVNDLNQSSSKRWLEDPPQISSSSANQQGFWRGRTDYTFEGRRLVQIS